MKIVILAAGYATRLYPLTKDKPKALLPIGSKPLLDHLFDKIAKIDGADEAILVTNDRFYRIFSDWAATKPARPKVTVLNDGTTDNDNRLGAIGDLNFAVKARKVQEDLLVLASDNLFDSDFGPFISFAGKKDAITVGAYDIQDKAIAAKRYGIFELDSASRVTNFEEKPDSPKTPFVSMGIYFFPKQTLGCLDEYLSSTGKQDAPGYYVTWLLKKKELFAYLFRGRWYDIGSKEQLEEASNEYEKR